MKIELLTLFNLTQRSSTDQGVGNNDRIPSPDHPLNMLPIVWKQEVEKAWKMVDLAHDREQEAKDTMESLQAEISHMNQLAGQSEQISSEQQET